MQCLHQEMCWFSRLLPRSHFAPTRKLHRQTGLKLDRKGNKSIQYRSKRKGTGSVTYLWIFARYNSQIWVKISPLVHALLLESVAQQQTARSLDLTLFWRSAYGSFPLTDEWRGRINKLSAFNFIELGFEVGIEHRRKVMWMSKTSHHKHIIWPWFSK